MTTQTFHSHTRTTILYQRTLPTTRTAVRILWPLSRPQAPPAALATAQAKPSLLTRVARALMYLLPTITMAAPSYAWAPTAEALAALQSQWEGESFEAMGGPVFTYVEEARGLAWKVGLRKEKA